MIPQKDVTQYSIGEIEIMVYDEKEVGTSHSDVHSISRSPCRKSKKNSSKCVTSWEWKHPFASYPSWIATLKNIFLTFISRIPITVNWFVCSKHENLFRIFHIRKIVSILDSPLFSSEYCNSSPFLIPWNRMDECGWLSDLGQTLRKWWLQRLRQRRMRLQMLPKRLQRVSSRSWQSRRMPSQRWAKKRRWRRCVV